MFSRSPSDSPSVPAQGNPALIQYLIQQIAQHPDQRLTFAEYMETVLYHPQYGYYSANPRIGARGDFVTSPHLGSDFGELLAEQFVDLWHRLDRPIPFTLVEMGAGQGLLAQDALRYLHQRHFDCFSALEYWIVEKSIALIQEQRQRLSWLTESGRVQWRTWDEIPAESIVGCCFSNELVDAFPVHQVTVHEGRLQEIYVTWEQNGFRETIANLSTPRLADYFQTIDIDLTVYGAGYRTEVNLVAIDWLNTVSDRLRQGYLLTIDYGYPAQRYYSPGRSQGTLQCYYQHAHHSDPYCYIGQQDLTAHVDFTALERYGASCGLASLGYTQQGLFLMALGLGDRLAALSDPAIELDLQDLLQRREALHALMNPLGLGNFGVLVQGKGLAAEQRSLKGLSEPM